MQIGDRLLHHARALHHLRQEHLAGAEQVADDVHAGHQRAFDDVQRLRQLLARLLRVGLDEIGDAVDERMREALLDRAFAPGEILLLGFRAAAVALEARRGLEQTVGGVGTAVQDHVLGKLAQLGGNVVVERRAGRR